MRQKMAKPEFKSLERTQRCCSTSHKRAKRGDRPISREGGQIFVGFLDFPEVIRHQSSGRSDLLISETYCNGMGPSESTTSFVASKKTIPSFIADPRSSLSRTRAHTFLLRCLEEEPKCTWVRAILLNSPDASISRHLQQTTDLSSVAVGGLFSRTSLRW